MNYIQSKAIREYWEESNYEPAFDEIVSCILANTEMSLKEMFEVFKSIQYRDDANRNLIDTFISKKTLSLKKFEEQIEYEPIVYYCDECVSKDGHFKIPLIHMHTNSFEEIKKEIKEIAECFSDEVDELWFYPEKIYVDKDCESIDACYRYKEGKFEVIDITDFTDDILLDGQIYNETNHPYKNLPFKPGDLIISNCDGEEFVITSIDYENDACEGYIVNKFGKLEKEKHVNLYEYDLVKDLEYNLQHFIPSDTLKSYQ